jgi:energy-coupling factor transporter ATP-binding protein EcfA2
MSRSLALRGRAQRIVGLIKRLSGDMAVLVIEHDIDRVFAFAEDITVMHNGAILAAGKQPKCAPMPKCSPSISAPAAASAPTDCPQPSRRLAQSRC